MSLEQANRLWPRVWQAAALVFLGLFVFAGQARASTYGSGTYGDCTVNTGCPAAASSTSTTTTQNTTVQSTVATTTSPTASTASVSDINLNDYGTNSTQAYHFKSATKGQSYKFKFTDFTGATQSHTLTINSISADSVKITLASIPQTFTLKSGQQVMVDLDGNGQADVGVLVESITPPTASIKLWHIAPTAASGSTTPTNHSSTRLRDGIALGVVVLLSLAIIRKIK